MLIRVWSKAGREHLWAYENIKEELSAITIDYNLMHNSIITSMIYSVPEDADLELISQYNMDYSIIDKDDSHEKQLLEIREQYQPKENRLRMFINERKGKESDLKYNYVNDNCTKCLCWEDDLNKCTKFGECEF